MAVPEEEIFQADAATSPSEAPQINGEPRTGEKRTYVRPKPEPLNLGVQPKHSQFSNFRSIKMLVPKCPDIKDEKTKRTTFLGCEGRFAGTRWWERCTHNPYFTARKHEETIDRLEDELDSEGNPTGRQKVVGEEVVVWSTDWPNLKEVTPTHSGQHKNIDGMSIDRVVRMRALFGYRLPNEHPIKPLQPFCEYTGCWHQGELLKTEHGSFCDMNAARLVTIGKEERPMEVFNKKKAAQQLREINVELV